MVWKMVTLKKVGKNNPHISTLQESYARRAMGSEWVFYRALDFALMESPTIKRYCILSTRA